MVGQTRDPRIQIASAYAATKRVMRRPQHTFTLLNRPWQLTPFMIAPVLPGETMKNLTLQHRVVSDPLKAEMKLVGWWTEDFIFYVKIRDFLEPEKSILTNMFLDPATDVSSLRASVSDVTNYTFEQGIKWMEFCMKTITEHFFRDDGEAWNSHTIDGMPQVQVFGKGHNSWTDSLTLDANKRNRDVAVPANIEDLDDQVAHYNALRDAGLVDMDFEDFVRTYGVQVRQEELSPELHRPELVRYVREWTYPTNIVEPTTGVPTSAVSWSIAQRADKDRFFKEPGFLIGLTVSRPKVNMKNLAGSLVGGMDEVTKWLPAVLQNHYETAFKMFTMGLGPARTLTDDYWVDMRDLFMHGDQFNNYNGGFVNTPAFIDIPSTSGDPRYAAAGDLDELFAAASPKNVLRHDGVVSLGILGRQRDVTPDRQL